MLGHIRRSTSLMAKTIAAQPTVGASARRSMATLDRAKTVEDRERVLDFFAEHRATAVLRAPTGALAETAMDAAISGGFKIAEFTLTTPNACDAVANFRAQEDGKTMIGCGTIMHVGDAERAVDAGAEFIITPVMLPEVIIWCAKRNIVCVPGCQTPTELYTAYQHGAPLQKVFPGVAGAHMWCKAVSAALPMLRLNPTSGVDLDNVADFLNNGCASVGLVAPLFPADAVAAGDKDTIAANAKRCMDNVKKCGPFIRS